ncbi:diguanylate cyclase [Thalassospira alkalitolerans]|uniref:diguanylate cyclase n=2 Tax=Thalassospira alkalitolerans TaxID=1293890 RepID=A0A1Y2LAP4_9PROT|nr:diguanylate cyclase [Thalassospira alkalitolerans]|tara:strand:+ start:35184 stop:36197 length:1014 start_codon:yes stop_codon:yes gene_type:complete
MTESPKKVATNSKSPTGKIRKMGESIAEVGMADAERDILAELDKALSEHISLMLGWCRHLVLPAGKPETSVHDHTEDHDCDFGAWYALNRHNRLIDQPAVHALAATHEQLHASAKRLLDGYDIDGDVDEAEFEMMSLRAESFFAQLRRLERAFRTARSDVDPLTGTYNRQTMLGDLSNERERSVRTDTPTAIALVDLDHFKLVNDTYGHQSGDLVLQSVAGILQSHVRPFDKVYRYGGEEFLICLPNADMKQCARVLERLRRVIEASPVTLTDGSILPVTASIGAAPMTKTRTIEQIIEKADQALYAAKEGGRNKIRVWRNPDSNKAVKSDNDTPKA